MKNNTVEMILPNSVVSLKTTDGEVHTNLFVLYSDNIGIAVSEKVTYTFTVDEDGEYGEPWESTYKPERTEMRLYPWNTIQNVRFGFIWKDGKVTDVHNSQFRGGKK
jgi:hypothetical protein